MSLCVGGRTIRTMDEKEQAELKVFLEFAAICPLPLVLQSARNCKPPEPDIVCDLTDGGQVAFELVEADDETDDKARPGQRTVVMKYAKESFQLGKAVQNAYYEAMAGGRLPNGEQFKHHFLRIDFVDAASVRQSLAAIPDLIDLLRGNGTTRKRIEHPVIRSIDCVPFPQRNSYEGPLISVNRSSFNVSTSVVDRITSKLAKSYTTAHPTHLVVWSNSAFAAEADFWRDEAMQVLEAGMGPFTQVWVFGRNEPSIVFAMPPVNDPCTDLAY
jgi:hypothetical protein